jgi:hypothetical protein
MRSGADPQPPCSQPPPQPAVTRRQAGPKAKPAAKSAVTAKPAASSTAKSAVKPVAKRAVANGRREVSTKPANAHRRRGQAHARKPWQLVVATTAVKPAVGQHASVDNVALAAGPAASAQRLTLRASAGQSGLLPEAALALCGDRR